jgi:hypothetical protein
MKEWEFSCFKANDIFCRLGIELNKSIARESVALTESISKPAAW